MSPSYCPMTVEVECPHCGYLRPVTCHRGAYSIKNACKTCANHLRQGGTNPQAFVLLRDVEWLQRTYAKTTTRALAKQLGVTETAVRQHLKRHGIRPHTKSDARRIAATQKHVRLDRSRQMVTAGAGVRKQVFTR